MPTMSSSASSSSASSSPSPSAGSCCPTVRQAEVLSPFSGATGEAEGWVEGAFDGEYCAFDPALLSLNDSLFNELLLAAHAFKVQASESEDGGADGNCGPGGDEVDCAVGGGGGVGRRKDYAPVGDANAAAAALAYPPECQTDLASYVELSADAFGLDRPCLVCRVLDVYRREYGFSAQWMADYAFLCAKCLASPPCATVTFIAGYELVYIMDKHFLRERGATLVSAFGRKILTHEDVQRHFFLHGCFRTDGGVPGRKQDDLVMARPRPGRPMGGRAGPLALGSAKVLYSNYSFLAQMATRAMMCTLSDYGIRGIGGGMTCKFPLVPAAALCGDADVSMAAGSTKTKRRREASSLSASSRISDGSDDICREQLRSCLTGERLYVPSASADKQRHDPLSSYDCANGNHNRRETNNGKSGGHRYVTAVLAPSNGGVGLGRACPTQLAVAMAGWKECAKGVECAPTAGRRGDSCVARAVRDDEEYELSLEREEESATVTDSYASLFPNCRASRDAAAASRGNHADFERTRGYGDLTLLLLAGTGAVPASGTGSGHGSAGSSCEEFVELATKIRKETVDTFWTENRAAFGAGAVTRFARFYEDDAEPDLDLGPVMLTQLKHAQTRSGTSAECLPCNLLIVKDYWWALRRLRRDIIAYSANNVGLFHSVEPVLDEWDEENKVGVDDGRCFINLMRGAGPEAVYKHMFCDPMCAARVAQTNPRVLFEHPLPSDKDELTLHKARLASSNRFEGRVCAGLWALAYAFKTYQVFPPRPTALAAFVKDAGSMLHRHSVSLISLEHTLGAYM